MEFCISYTASGIFSHKRLFTLRIFAEYNKNRKITFWEKWLKHEVHNDFLGLRIVRLWHLAYQTWTKLASRCPSTFKQIDMVFAMNIQKLNLYWTFYIFYAWKIYNIFFFDSAFALCVLETFLLFLGISSSFFFLA